MLFKDVLMLAFEILDSKVQYNIYQANAILEKVCNALDTGLSCIGKCYGVIKMHLMV